MCRCPRSWRRTGRHGTSLTSTRYEVSTRDRLVAAGTVWRLELLVIVASIAAAVLAPRRFPMRRQSSDCACVSLFALSRSRPSRGGVER